MRLRLWAMASTVMAMNLGAILALLALRQFGAATLAVGLVAYGLGVRHAFDADHIAAIDNVTRRLRQQGQRPVAVGYFFSLGHSTIVLLLILAMAVAFDRMHALLLSLTGWGTLISTLCSAAILTAIGLANLVLLARLVRATEGKHVGECSGPYPASQAAQPAWLVRLASWIDSSWKMYPVGMAFGLGFDTATEVALLAISVGALQSGQFPIWAVMLFPLLFTAGMCFMDSLQSLVMLRVYDWALVDADRSLKLNTMVTGISVFLALGVAGFKWADLGSLSVVTSGRLDLAGSSGIGLVVSAVMLLLWLSSWLYRWHRRVPRQEA